MIIKGKELMENDVHGLIVDVPLNFLSNEKYFLPIYFKNFSKLVV